MTNERVVELLECLGWDIETAREAKLEGKVADYKLLRHARENNRIYVTFDELKGEHGHAVGKELRRRGGSMVQIHGGADQNKFRIVGKILFHFPEWYPFRIKKDGVSVISDTKNNCQDYSPEEWRRKINHKKAEQFTRYLKRIKNKPYKPRGHRKKQSSILQSRLTGMPDIQKGSNDGNN
jgi:hypothetical protein